MSDWNQIVGRNAAQVVNAAYRVLGNVADAEDVAQEVFLEAVRKWTTSSEHQWAGLLRRMAVCRAIDALRARRTTEVLSPAEVDKSAGTPDRTVIELELQQAVRRSVAALPQREAEVFCLVHFERMSHDEVAKTLDMKKSAVAAALSRARAKLAKLLMPTIQGESP